MYVLSRGVAYIERSLCAISNATYALSSRFLPVGRLQQICADTLEVQKVS